MEIAGLIICFLGRTREPVFCFGILIFLEIEYNKVDEPNKPVSNGRRGWFKERFRVAIPRKPERMKRVGAQSFSFSFAIRNMEIQIRKKAIIFSMKGYSFGIVRRKIIDIGIRRTIAREEPTRVRRIASWPLPRIRNLCPGIVDRAVSSSGAPR